VDRGSGRRLHRQSARAARRIRRRGLARGRAGVSEPATPERRALTPLRATLYGAAVVGAIDFAYATIFVVAKGRPWYRPWQGVAISLLGPDSLNGGYATAAFGVFLHFCVATCIVSTYMIASRRFGFLRRQTLVSGLVFGFLAFVVMNF